METGFCISELLILENATLNIMPSRIGKSSKALGLKDKLPTMTEDEQLALLATDGMLVKRPLLVADDLVLVGFREKEWEERL